jgi:putative ABC transport system ATP-binding protein
MIKIKSLSKIFKDGKNKVTALSGVGLSIKRGECVIIGGPSGSGKTTLLNIIGCLTRPTQGEVLIENKDISRLPEHFLCELRRGKIGFIFQQFNLFSGYTAIENVGMPLVPLGIPLSQRQKLSEKLLCSLGLAERMDFNVNELSGGEQQRVAIARALINNPDIIIADEPISNIDSENAARIINIFTELIKEGKTFITTTHNGALTKELPITARYEINRGRLL